jgi:septal ring factor EnvC (AmiA/AmiB activator)
MQIDMTVDTTSIENQEKDLEVIVQKEIVDQASYDKAAETIKSVKSLLKEIDDTFNDMIQKAHELHKTALSKKNKYADPLKAMEKTLKAKMTRWITEQEKKRMAEEARIRAAREKEAEELRMMGITDTPVEPVKVEEVQKSGIIYQTKWDFEIVDKELIPRDYLIPDEKKIGQIVKAMKNETNIPGIKVIESKVAVVR